MAELFAQRGESCVSERRDICKNWIKLYLPKEYMSATNLAEVGAMMWRRLEQ